MIYNHTKSAFTTTARLSPNDRTIGPQRPHNSALTTARFGCIE
ncbi:hypothetical protein BACCOPRO_02880 [Phocaeicola coprophilus DSM 18228 = JCM 13818]|uniref:Uncharacterized protein n=1 Tax=Phocaeicola coprophilus DSM 18228 = JCM 13818 TaxID=547042 RepID=S0FB79_9BACT|nr:hypothetical protein BACCOPRO_02880 [Phocaeicola coprophilus DSM 18228 = JCM 13818]